MKFRSVLPLAAAMCLAAPCAATYTPGDTLTVTSGETVTVTDADIDEFNTLASVTFADATGVLVFNTATPPTVPISGSGTIRKTSSDEWTIGVDRQAFTGTWDFVGGTTVITSRYALTSENCSSPVYVRSGATLALDFTLDAKAGRTRFSFGNNRTLHLAGKGHNGMGALRLFTDSNTESNKLRTIELDDDATISMAAGAYLYVCSSIGGSTSLITLNGHTLTLDGKNNNSLFYAVKGRVPGPGRIVVTNSNPTATGYAGFCTRGTLLLDPSVEIVLHDHTRVYVYNDHTTNYFAKLTVEGSNCRFVHTHQSANRPCAAHGTHDFWAGEVNLKNPTSRLYVGSFKNGSDNAETVAAYALGILGPVTGPGSLGLATDTGQNIGHIYLTCPTNSYTGETGFSGTGGATLHLPCSNNVPVYANFSTDTPITLTPSLAEHGWGASSVARFATDMTYTGDKQYDVLVDASELEGGKLVFTDIGKDLTGDVLNKVAGTEDTVLEFATPLGCKVKPIADVGMVRLTGSGVMCVTNLPAVSVTNKGEVVVDGADGMMDLQLVPRPFYVSPAHGAKRVTLSNCMITQALNTANFAAGDQAAVMVGYKNGSRHSPGDVVVGEGVVVTARLQIARVDYSCGRVVQTGGDVTVMSSFGESWAGASIGYGTSANGYYQLDSGRFTVLGALMLGSYGSGVFRQNGGSMSILRHPNSTSSDANEAWLDFSQSAGGKSHFIATGGTTHFSGVLLGTRADKTDTALTVSGSAVVTAAAGINYGYGSNGVFTITLKDGGTLRNTQFVSRFKAYEYDNKMPGVFPETYLNADGGRLVAIADGTRILGDPAVSDPRSTKNISMTRIAFYGKGLTIDVTNRAQTACGAITPATGKGVASIPWTPVEGLVVSPFVQITGDGHGASAVVEVDAAGNATGVTVISPGFDYSWAQARIYSGPNGSSMKYTTVDCVLADNDGSGGLTVEGTTGTLTLMATNTYRGATTLAGGTLKMGCDWAIPVDSTIVLGGGKLNMNSKTLEDGSILPKNWAVDMDRVRAGGTVTNNWSLAFPEGATFTVLNAGELTESDKSISTLLYVNGTVTGAPAIQGVTDPRWKVAWNGNRLALRYIRGAVMTIR